MSHNGNEFFQLETMMSPADFTDMCSKMTAIIHGVMQTNLRGMLEFSRIDNPQASRERDPGGRWFRIAQRGATRSVGAGVSVC
jgi:hypothetical protein